MKTKIRKIGNSFGIILSKKILEQCELKDKVSLSVIDSKIVIEAIKDNPREKWEERLLKAKSLENTEESFYFENDFDKNEWTW